MTVTTPQAGHPITPIAKYIKSNYALGGWGKDSWVAGTTVTFIGPHSKWGFDDTLGVWGSKSTQTCI